MLMLKHPDGYIGQVEMDEVADILSGRVIGIRDGITFEGKTPKEVRKAFDEAIDEYKAFCRELGQEPKIPERTQHMNQFHCKHEEELFAGRTGVYRGYEAQLTVVVEDGIIHGQVLGLKDVIDFAGVTVPDALQAFRSSVDGYIAFCQNLGREPETPSEGICET